MLQPIQAAGSASWVLCTVRQDLSHFPPCLFPLRKLWVELGSMMGGSVGGCAGDMLASPLEA
jgi:hypothetical protein